MGRDVIIFDTTLRDGEQAPGNSMTAEEKLRLARQLDTLGVDVIEAGFPSASEGDRRAVWAIAEGVRRPVIAALARCHDRDIDLAGEAVRPAARPRVHVFIATSDLHLECKLRLSRDQCLERAREAVQRARRYTDDVEFSAEDATRTDLEFLCRVVEAAIAAGATTINLPDTVGYALPVEYASMFRTPTASCSARTATTTSGSPWPTRWPRSKPEPGRSSAPSTASVSVRATRRWKRSSWRVECGRRRSRSTAA